MDRLYTSEQAELLTAKLLEGAGLGQVKLTFGEGGVHIENSYLVRSRELRLAVCAILADTEGFTQPASRMSAEWLGHNAFYRLTRHPGARSADVEYSGDKRLVVRLAARLMDRLGLH